MQKNKVLFEAGPMVAVQKTGVGYYVKGLVQSLVRYGERFEFTGYFFNFLRLNDENMPSVAGLSLHRIWLIPGKLLSVCRRLGFQPFLELFTWKQANIVLYTNYVALPLLHRKRKVALVVYDLSFLDHPEFTQGVNLKFLKRFCPPSIRKADLIITISEFTKQRLAYHFPELKSPVIVTPIPPVAQTLGGHLPQNLTGKGIKDNKYVLYIGTIEPRKNLQTLLRAWEIMSEELNSEYSLVLAGGKGWKDEAIRADIETLRTKGLRIVLPGYITDDEKCALYSNASCFVLPSHYEGFGMPILEAMQYGVPVAASDIPVFHEVASEAAIYFNKDNPEDIASKLLVLLKDDDLKTKLVAAGASRLRQFSWEKNAQLVANALDRLT